MDHPMAVVLLTIGIVAFSGLFAALWPEEFARVCLSKWHRERVAENMGSVSWSGWLIFGFSLFGIVLVLILSAFNR
jgi:hypothetical protein